MVRYRPITAGRPAPTVGRVGAIGESGTRRAAQSVIPLHCLFLGKDYPVAARRLSLARREALHEDQDPATRRQHA